MKGNSRAYNRDISYRKAKRKKRITNAIFSGYWEQYLKTVGFLNFQGPHHLHGAVSSFAINPPSEVETCRIQSKKVGVRKSRPKNDT